VDEERGQVTVRGGKGDQDRVTVLPNSVKAKLPKWKESLRQIHEEDRAAGTPGVALPTAFFRCRYMLASIDLRGLKSVDEAVVRAHKQTTIRHR
ncbi:MAG: hypothetical protein AAF585_24705, partial [Verrucomicrobiota bacterium]